MSFQCFAVIYEVNSIYKNEEWPTKCLGSFKISTLFLLTHTRRSVWWWTNLAVGRFVNEFNLRFSNYKECISDMFCGLFSENGIYTAPVYSWIKTGNCWPNQKSVVGCMLWKIIYSRREVRENQRVRRTECILTSLWFLRWRKKLETNLGLLLQTTVQPMKRTA